MIAPVRTHTRQERIILVGPDPRVPRGGVAVAVGGFAEALREHGVLHEVISSYEPGHRARHLPTAARSIRRAVRRVRADGYSPVVWAHAGGPLSVARKAMLLRVAKACGARTLLQLHSVHTEHLVTQRRTRRLTRLALRAADDITCVAPYWQRLVADQLGRDRVHVVSNPLPAEAERQARIRPPPRQAGPLRLLSLTHLAPNKGLELLIDALAEGPSAPTLEIGGRGPLRESLEERVRQRGLQDRVRFLGWIEGARKHEALMRADVFALPTRYDSFGMGFVEAASYGVPSLALRYKAVPEVVLHGTTGRLAESATPAALAEEIMRLEDPEERARLGESARRRAIEHHGRVAIMRRLSAILDGEC